MQILVLHFSKGGRLENGMKPGRRAARLALKLSD
jgi:hypothetical protein